MSSFSSAFWSPRMPEHLPYTGSDFGHNYNLRTPQTQRFGFDSASSSRSNPASSSPLSAYNPLTPSPLRELRNVNVIPIQIQMGSETENGLGGTAFGFGGAEDNSNENNYGMKSEFNENGKAAISSPFNHPQIEQELPAEIFGVSQSIEQDTPQLQTPIFSFDVSSHVQSNIKPRSRHQTPQSQLSNQTIQNRLTRKSQFLNRLKNQRAEDRDERIGDQVLRGEYLRQQRSWETFYSRQAEALDMPVEEEESNNLGVSEIETIEIPEDLEMEEDYYPTFGEDEMSDEGYDEIFMEVLSQQQPDQQGETSLSQLHNDGRANGDPDSEML